MDYYKVLGLTKGASTAEVKSAYRNLSKKFHPDLNGNNPHYTQMFIQVKEAYDVLEDESKRTAYDSGSSASSNYDSVFYQSATKRQSINAPIIYSFVSELPYFFEGDVLMFSWDCRYADTIQILPFGFVDSLTGKVNYRINNYRKRYLPVELIATDSKSGKRVSKRIILENGLYRKFSEDEKKASEGVYSENEELRFKTFFNPVGRLSRKTYAKRTLALVFLWFFFYALQGVDFLGAIFRLVTIVGSFVFLVQTARRFQDLGWSAVFSFLILIPYVNVVTYLALLYFKGDSGINRFGRPVE